MTDDAGWTNGKSGDSCSPVPGSIPGPATNPIAPVQPHTWICLEDFVDQCIRDLTDESLKELVIYSTIWAHQNVDIDGLELSDITLRERLEMYLEDRMLEAGYNLTYRGCDTDWTLDELNGIF